MLLFIISEIMVFGAFFTAYFFIRVVGGAEWPAEGDQLPKLIAGFNTAVLVSSSFTMHWAQESREGQPARACSSAWSRRSCSGVTFLFVQINEYVHIGFSPQDHAQGTIFYGLTGLHGAHVFIGLMLLALVTIRAFRGHFSSGGAPRHRGAGDLLALRRHHVDRRLHDGLHHLMINPLRSEREAFRFLLYVLAGRGGRDRAAAARAQRAVA